MSVCGGVYVGVCVCKKVKGIYEVHISMYNNNLYMSDRGRERKMCVCVCVCDRKRGGREEERIRENKRGRERLGTDRHQIS